MPPVLPQASQPAQPVDQVVLPNGIRVEYAAHPPLSGGEDAGPEARSVFTPDEHSRWALFSVVEGAPPESAAALHAAVIRALERDRGTATARLLRAVRDGCRRLETQALHRFELAGMGLTALLLEEGHATFVQLLPSQAYVVTPDAVRSLPEVPMRGAAWVGAASGRRWEVEIDSSRVPLQPGAIYVLCTSSMADQLTPAALQRSRRLPPRTAAAQLVPARAAATNRQRLELLVVRVAPQQRPPRPRLLSMESQRRPRPIPTLEPPRPGPPVLAWGLRRRHGWPLLDRLLDPVPTVRSRQRSRRAMARLAAAGAAMIAAGGALYARGQVLPPNGPMAPGASQTDAVPATAVLAGRPLYQSPHPLRSLAFAGGAAYVVDAAGSMVSVRSSAGGASSSSAIPAPGGSRWLLLAARDDDVLAIDAQRTLWRLPLTASAGTAALAEEARPVPLRGATSWRNPVAAAAYAGNLYVLDVGDATQPGQIWRHAASAPNVYDAEAQPWLAPNAGVSLAGATSFAIDGAIWVAHSDGALLKLTSGRAEPFQVTGLESSIASAGAVYTERAFAAVYVLDSAARRLVRLGKDGRVTGQVLEVFRIGEQPRGLSVDEAAGRALVLTDSRLQEVLLA